MILPYEQKRAFELLTNSKKVIGLKLWILNETSPHVSLLCHKYILIDKKRRIVFLQPQTFQKQVIFQKACKELQYKSGSCYIYYMIVVVQCLSARIEHLSSPWREKIDSHVAR